MGNQKYEQFRGKARLPKFAVPKHYALKLKPDLIAGKFKGSVEISVDVNDDTKLIVLNAAKLSIDQNTVRFKFQNGSKVMAALKVELLGDDEIVVIEFAKSLPVGVGILCLTFEGSMLNGLKGFYTSTFEHNGKEKKMAVTQFEPADARLCFPCWDEPVYKATFKVTIVDVPSEFIALSNMPVVQEISSWHNLKTVSFEESPIMSTYLVAIVIGLFDYLEDHTSDGTKVRVYCPVGKANQGKFALDFAVKTLDYYKGYFGVPYSLPKLDMVAIPDLAAGAMENYGLVTYREINLLCDVKHSAAANKQKVAVVVAHELAHQWFGNLVTMEWWTDLWLNEGFATWVTYLAIDSLYPDWNMWTQFLTDNNLGLQLDGLSGSHPIQVEVNHARDSNENFDAITYYKGAYVIRMLESYLGPKGFQISFKVATIAADAAPKLLDNIKLFFINLFQYSAGRLGWDPKQEDSHLDAKLRGELLTALAQFGHDVTLNEASKRFQGVLDDRKTSLLPPDLRKAVYVAVMQNVSTTNRSGFDSLLRAYKKTDRSEEKTRILASLGSCRDPDIILEVLKFLLTSEVRNQDIVFGLAVSREGREIAWKWLKDNWEDLLQKLDSGSLMARLFDAILSPFSSYEKAKEIEEFFASRTKPSFERTLKQNIEQVHINANWVRSIQNDKQLPKVVEELAYNKYKKSSSFASTGSFKKTIRRGFSLRKFNPVKSFKRYVLGKISKEKEGSNRKK